MLPASIPLPSPRTCRREGRSTASRRWLTDGLFSIEHELTVPATLDGVITAEVTTRLNSKVLVEAANGPTTASADPILEGRGITVIPDVLANAGGVVASSFEWAQSRQGWPWSLEMVEDRLAQTMEQAFDAVMALAAKLGVSPRRATVALGVSRVTEGLGGPRVVAVRFDTKPHARLP